MKRYSSEYFEKKFKILFDKLLIKEGFIDEIKKTRKELGIPVEKGFSDALHLTEYLAKKLTEDEKHHLVFFQFIERYEAENKVRITGEEQKEHRDKIVNAFLKKTKGRVNIKDVMVVLLMRIDDHNNFITDSPSVRDIKAFAELFSKEFEIFQEFFGVDLLDAHIIMHFIEKYLFLGQGGVFAYIKEKIACPACRHIGISHFSPTRYDMEGQDLGPFSGKYIFHENTVRLLSSHFNSYFLIIKTYATKEQAVQYIKENWDHIREHLIEKNTFYKQFDVHPSKIKESDFEQNRLVYELFKLPKQELATAYDGEKDFSVGVIYKESIVSAILKEKYGIEMSAEAVKKTASRFSKSTQVKNKPKDIRDI